MRSLVRSAVVLLCIAIAPSCGGGLDHAAYVKKVNGICDSFNKSNSVTQPSSAQEVPTFVDKIVPAFQDETNKVAALKPPGADKAKVTQMVSDLRSVIPQLQNLKTAVVNRDAEAFATARRELNRIEIQVNQEAAALGLTVCAQS
jgi:hypothetical protein